MNKIDFAAFEARCLQSNPTLRAIEGLPQRTDQYGTDYVTVGLFGEIIPEGEIRSGVTECEPSVALEQWWRAFSDLLTSRKTLVVRSLPRVDTAVNYVLDTFHSAAPTFRKQTVQYVSARVSFYFD